jgi:diguanylate cyclase (GGDEF)-like protein
VIPSAFPASEHTAPLSPEGAPPPAGVAEEDRLRIKVLFFIAASCAALMLPLAAFRWSDGAHTRALFNLFVAAVCFALAVGLRRAKRLGMLGWGVAVVPFMGSVVTQLLERDTVAAWVFPCLVTYFVIFGRRTATLMAAVNLAVLGILTVVVLRAPAVQLVVLLVAASWTVGLMIALVTEVEQKQREIERLATSDPLTGTGNRRALAEALSHARRQLARRREQASLVLLDVDHFKVVNDRHGHEAGDQLLVELTRLVRSRIRDEDQLFRYGGEEFVLLLRHTPLEGAARMAEELRALLASQLTSGGWTVTASFGCAELLPGEEPSEWLTRADAAMYVAKAEGRNRVVRARPGVATGGAPSAGVPALEPAMQPLAAL